MAAAACLLPQAPQNNRWRVTTMQALQPWAQSGLSSAPRRHPGRRAQPCVGLGARHMALVLAALLLLWAPHAAMLDLADREERLIGYRETSRDEGSLSQAQAADERDQALSGGSGDFQFQHVLFATPYGTIRARLRRDMAPVTVDYIEKAVATGVYVGCSFYRAEPAGPTLDDGAQQERAGYALLQGGAYQCQKQEETKLVTEGRLPLTRGRVALIGGTSEFFIAVAAHPEWDNAFSVWAEVEDPASFAVMDSIVALPTRQEKHPTGTVLRILITPVMHNISLAQ